MYRHIGSLRERVLSPISDPKGSGAIQLMFDEGIVAHVIPTVRDNLFLSL